MGSQPRWAPACRRSRALSRALPGALLATALLLAGAPASAQQDDSSAPLLTADQAVAIALERNRQVRIAALEIEKSGDEVAATKTRRLPSFNTYVFGSELLIPISFTFEQGVFGTYSGVGPIPATDTEITTPRRPTFYVVAQVAQPLTQLYKINLSIRSQELTEQMTRERFRGERQTTADNVRRAYYAIVQTENQIEATAASIRQYRELDRVTMQYVSQQAVLPSDSLEVKARLAGVEFQLLQLRNTLASQRESLNDLLGRDLSTAFRTQEVSAASLVEIDLRLAQQKALAQRPEVREAELAVQQADYGRRLAKAQYIPDLGIAFHYLSPFGVKVLPNNVASVGFEMSWEPFDWGRRKHEVDQKKIALTQCELRLQESQSKVLLDVNQRFRKLQEARALLAVAQASRQATKEKLREVTNRYAQQAVLLRDVLQQQAAVAAAESDYNQALAGFWTAKADLAKAVGEE